MKGEVMVRIGILKNISARGKLADAFDYIRDILEQGQKIVVFCNLKEIINHVQEKFPKSVRVTGSEDDKQKQAAVDKFQNDPDCKLIACNLKAAGVGITLTASQQVCFIEFGWHAAIMDQAEDRCYRLGQHANVMCTYFLGKNTIDEWNYELIQTKREIANTVTGNEDDVEISFIDKVMNLFSA
jgi:SWI/SNF-related matrix-associated actin-dependent regulator 1 of chromatin subfamily A